MVKLYMVTIQDGENSYSEWTTTKPTKDYVDGFMRAVKNITIFEATQKEIETLTKFLVI